MTESLTKIYERDRSVWDNCARTYERQIVGGHPDVTAYEEFEEDFLDELLHYLMGEQKQTVKLIDAGCGSARLHCRFGLQMIDTNRLPADVAARVRAARARLSGCAYEFLVADRLRAVEGIDFSAEMIALAKEKLTDAGLGRLVGSRLQLVQGSAFDFVPMASEPLPVMVSVCNSIGVMQGPAGAVSLFRSVRRAVEEAGGVAVISAYRKEAVASFALGNYETTLDVCGQPQWLDPDTFAGAEYVQVPWGYKRAYDPDPKVTVDVLDHDGKVVLKGHDLTRNPEEVARTIESGHIRTHTDYESHWYSFEQFESWIADLWGGCNTYHLAGTSLDAIRAKPAQFAILDPRGRLERSDRPLELGGPTPDMGDRWILWGVVASYMVFIFVKGVMKAREIGDADDFLVAGRNVGWFLLFCTMGATVVGGGASIGAIGRTYEWGVLMLLVSTGWYLQLIFSGLFVAPKFRSAKLYTVAGYFGHRFGERPRFMMLILSVLFSVFVVAAQMAAFGSVLSAIIGDESTRQQVLTGAIIVGGTMVVIYSTAGGLLAVIHTDVYQFIVLIFGFVITLVACIPAILESWGSITLTVPDSFFSPEGGKGWLFLLTTFLAFLFGETFAPGYATRYCVGKDIKETRYGIAGAGFFLALVFPVILFFIALYAKVQFPNLPPQEALPTVVQQLNSPIVAGLMIGALLMAVMSSADSALNSATAIFVKDLFEHQLHWRDTGDGRLLRLARVCSIALGIVSILIAVLWPDIIGLLLFTYHVWAPAVILPICVGVFSKHRSSLQSRDIFIAMVAATGLTLLYRLLPFVNDRFGWSLLAENWYELMGQLDASVFGVAVSCLVYGSLRLGRASPLSVIGKANR